MKLCSVRELRKVALLNSQTATANRTRLTQQAPDPQFGDFGLSEKDRLPYVYMLCCM